MGQLIQDKRSSSKPEKLAVLKKNAKKSMILKKLAFRHFMSKQKVLESSRVNNIHIRKVLFQRRRLPVTLNVQSCVLCYLFSCLFVCSSLCWILLRTD